MFESLLIKAATKLEWEGTLPNYKESMALRLIRLGLFERFTLKL